MTLHITNEVNATLNSLIEGGNYNAVMTLVDENTRRLVLPLLPCLSSTHVIEIAPGDENKNLGSITHVWQEMEECGATRNSLLINLGGGAVTDLGGFAAATFKRGISFFNVPTTLLGAVDAAVGGKTGINFDGGDCEHHLLLNITRARTEIGLCRDAQARYATFPPAVCHAAGLRL